MRLQIVSDLHLEFGPVNIAASVVDAVVLAGDIGVGTNGLDWIRQRFKDCPVIYVLGNHEFYHHSIPELTAKIQTETDGTNIHLLENSAVELQGFTFLGCSLWTDFALRGNAGNELVPFFKPRAGENKQRFSDACERYG